VPHVFIHIPSTAGTTLWTTFSRAYGDRVRRVRMGSVRENEDELRRILTAPAGGPDLVGGHVRFVALTGLRDRARCIALVRDPLDRVVSHWYRRVRNGRRPEAGDPESPDHADLALFAERSGFEALRYLSALDESALGKLNAAFTDADVAELCREISSNMWFIGFAEDYDTSLVALSHHLGWARVPHYDRQNQGGNKRPVPPPVLAALAERTRLETAVVAALRARALASWRETIPRFERRCYAYSLIGGGRRAVKALVSPSYRSRHIKQGTRRGPGPVSRGGGEPC